MPAETEHKVACSAEMAAYFKRLADENNACYAIAEKAKALGRDPEPHVEIPQAEDLASRVEKLLSDYHVEGIAERIRQLTLELGNRELVSLMVSKEIAKRPAETKEKAIDRAVRAGLAVLTEGILVAPLEGIAETKIKKNADGSDYIDLIFAGPIRAAGGTGQAMSVLIADVVRQEMGIGKYIPTQPEVERFIEEIPLYKQNQHLQYTPTAHEIELIVGKCPVCIDGEGTEQVEISGFRDLPRIETNRVRGGACLVIAEGMCQKASKLQKHVKKLNLGGWEFLDEYLAGKNVVTDEATNKREVKPSDKYLKDLVAGRPIFGHPSRFGAFRLRYGRGRTCGTASLAYSPASMFMLDSFPALGTQLKIERPGKACVVTPCDELEGPTVLLKNGDLVYCRTKEESIAIRKEVSEITDCGEVLIPYGEFCENNHFLVPCGYPIEWHKLELQDKLKDAPLPDDWNDPSWERAKQMSKDIGVPLHPKFNLFWSDIALDRLTALRNYILANGKIAEGRLHLKNEPITKRALEDLAALHQLRSGEIIISEKYTLPLIECLGLKTEPEGKISEAAPFAGSTSLEAISKALGIEVRARAMTRIGTRMGRPEKSDDRSVPKLNGLFPITDNPDFRKDVITAAAKISAQTGLSRSFDPRVEVAIGERQCPVCKEKTYRTWCRKCNTHTNFITASNGRESTMMKIDIMSELNDALALIGETKPADVKVMEELISKTRTPEALEKAILRAKFNLTTYKDGTIRYDMTDIPTTHFRPREIGLSVEKAIQMGYTHDMDGKPLTSPEQLCELRVQDVIPNIGCGKHMVKVANFMDELLEKFYGLPKFYNVNDEKDIIGQLGIGLAPHTSGGILCRIIGYTEACGCFAHPFFHAAKRRNCDGDEDSIILLMDGLVNFSRLFIPDRRGGLMDAPLVLTTRLDPNEIDKEAHNVDCLRAYPLEFYKAAMELRDAKEVEKSMDLVGGRIGTEKQYEGIGFTHDTHDIAEGPIHSAYTTLGPMIDKMTAQLQLGHMIRAVDEKDVATKVIDKHFMPDMIGNLRSFSAQTVRCTKCGEKYRRPPMSGKCNKCGNSLTLTVYEASVKKYLNVSQDICDKYGLSDYTKERIDILQMSMDSLFNSDKIKKCKLTDFF